MTTAPDKAWDLGLAPDGLVAANPRGDRAMRCGATYGAGGIGDAA